MSARAHYRFCMHDAKRLCGQLANYDSNRVPVERSDLLINSTLPRNALIHVAETVAFLQMGPTKSLHDRSRNLYVGVDNG